MSDSIHGDLSARVVVDTKILPWASSPSGTVWRKRLHLVGPPESGQVTSLVRYEPDSHFHEHFHPQGEEILVLDGVFSDEHGDWPAGTYLLNPEGFRHAPFSRGGCLLFVKLRQFPGKDRRHVAKKTHNMPWQESHGRGVKLLYAQDSYMDSTRIEQWLPGTMSGELSYPHGAELLVLQGAFEDEHGAYDVHTWIRLPAHSRHRPTTQAGASCMSKKVDLPTCARRRSLPRELKKIKSC